MFIIPLELIDLTVTLPEFSPYDVNETILTLAKHVDINPPLAVIATSVFHAPPAMEETGVPPRRGEYGPNTFVYVKVIFYYLLIFFD